MPKKRFELCNEFTVMQYIMLHTMYTCTKILGLKSAISDLVRTKTDVEQGVAQVLRDNEALTASVEVG